MKTLWEKIEIEHNLQYLHIEIYKVKKGISPTIRQRFKKYLKLI